MKRKMVITVISLMMGLFMTAPVFAAATVPGFTGWVSEAGTPVYYLNGTRVTDSWVRQGNTYYYMNADGIAVPGFVVNQDGVGASGITVYINTNNGGKTENVTPFVPDTYKPVRDIYSVTTDYDAFVKRYSGYAQAYGVNDLTYQAYIASYNGQTPGTKYLDAYLSYLNDTFTNHLYNHHYEYMQNDTHKAYCECGAWEIQNCRRDVALGIGGPYQCPKCYSVK